MTWSVEDNNDDDGVEEALQRTDEEQECLFIISLACVCVCVLYFFEVDASLFMCF
jgi:hypothetical protein